MKLIGFPEELIKHLEQYRTSKVTQAEYCRNNKLNYHQFGYWRRKEEKRSEAPLIPIKLTTREPSTGTICAVKFGQGLCLEVYDIEALSFILEKINGAPGHVV